MKFILKDKKYSSFDFIKIPFSCAPFAAIGLVIQKCLTGIAAVVQVVALANLLDNINNSVTLFWFSLLLLCVSWRRISFKVGAICSKRLEVKAITQMNAAFTQKRSKIHFSLLENEKIWELINRVCEKPERQVYFMLNRTCNLFVYIIRIFGVLYIVFTQVWWIGILTSLACIPLMITSMRSGNKNYNANKEAVGYERRHQYLAQVLSGREAVNERTLFQYSEKVNQEWYKQFEAARKIRLMANIIQTRMNRGSSVVITILSSFIIVALIVPVAEKQISIGMFIALATGMYDLVNMVGIELTKSVSQLSGCKAYLNDLTEFSKLTEVEGAECLPIKTPPPFQKIEFRNVSFCYPQTDNYILNHLNMTIESGKHYAFVGVNGAGKTTIIKLITGLYDNYEGEILINGESLKTYPREQLKAMFGGIYQDFAKYSLTVRDNISIGALNMTDEVEKNKKMMEILNSLGLLEDIEKMPKGLDTPLGKVLEEGIDVSGGQWQRIAMARTLMSLADLLILDEPTAALDPISESNIYKQFETMSKGKTTIFISHRLGSTKLADQIFVFEHGKMIESGCHEELMVQNGGYALMYESQRGWYQ